MGILGLTTFIENSFDGKWVKYEPKGHLVIDGFSLCYTIHANFNIDWIHGGQYWHFRDVLLKFFNALKSSDINPVVVFDGIDFKLQKQKVIWRRRKDNVKIVKSQLTAAGDRPRAGSTVLPLMASEVFREVLEEMGVSLYFADGEADPDTVAIANHYRCPIVANDSDYYMFDCAHGYIPLSHLSWQSKPVTADMYTLKQFETVYNIGESQLSRLIPAILGNDFVNGMFDTDLKEHILMSAKPLVDHSKRSHNIESLIRYISKFKNLPEILEDISKNVANGSRIAEIMKKNLTTCESMYNVSHTLTEEVLMNETQLVTSKGLAMPEWILRQYRNGYFVSSLMETLVIGQAFLRVATDDPHKPSSLLSSRPIRQSIYTILLPLMKEGVVSEVLRFEGDLRREEVHGLPSNDLTLFPAVQEISAEQRISILCNVLGINPSVLHRFDRKWKLVVAACCYWIKVCHPGNHLMKSLILVMLFCSQNRDPMLLLPRFVREDRNGKWMNALHKFSSFQSIYLDLAKLNNILMNPLLFVSPAFIFDGRLAQFYACKKDIDKIVEREFGSSALYTSLHQVFSSIVPVPRKQTNSTPRPSSDRQPDNVDNGAATKPKASTPSGISNNPYALLMMEDSDDSESSNDA